MPTPTNDGIDFQEAGTSSPQSNQSGDGIDFQPNQPSKDADTSAADNQNYKDRLASNGGLDSTSMAGDINAYADTLPADQRQAYAVQGLKDTALTAGGAALSMMAPEVSSRFISSFARLPESAKHLLNVLGVPTAEEFIGKFAEKGADLLGVPEAKPYIAKVTLLAQLASKGWVGKGIGAEKILDEVKGQPTESNGLEAVPSATMESVEPDPTMVTSPYTTGLSYQHQGQGYQASPSGLLLPH